MITEISPTVCTLIRGEINAALVEVGKKHGISLKTIGGGTYTSDNFTVKVEAAVVRDGAVVTKEAKEFKQLASLFGLKESDLNREVMIGGEKCQIIGMKSRSYKFPILAKKLSTGQVFKYPVAVIQRALGVPVTKESKEPSLY